MSFEFYKILHYIGLFLLFFGLGGVFLANYSRAEFSGKTKYMGAVTHGIGMAFTIIAGFGMLAKGNFGFPNWIWIKLLIWFLLGLSISIARRKSDWGVFAVTIFIVLGGVAAGVALLKPF